MDPERRLRASGGALAWSPQGAQIAAFGAGGDRYLTVVFHVYTRPGS
jgi:hypothetical protein